MMWHLNTGVAHVQVVCNTRSMSRQQIKFLRSAIYPPIAAHFGCDAADVHEFALGTAYGWEVVQVFDLKRRRPLRRSSDLTTPELADLIDMLIKRCRDIGIIIDNTESI